MNFHITNESTVTLCGHSRHMLCRCAKTKLSLKRLIFQFGSRQLTGFHKILYSVQTFIYYLHCCGNSIFINYANMIVASNDNVAAPNNIRCIVSHNIIGLKLTTCSQSFAGSPLMRALNGSSSAIPTRGAKSDTSEIYLYL